MQPNPTHRPFPISWRAALVTLALVLQVGTPDAQAQPSAKKIGFSIEVHTESFVSSTVARVVVSQVQPDSQALAAGVAVGDEVVRIEAVPVPGNSALKLKDHMAFVPGVPKKITFKRAGGAPFEVVFVRAAVAKGGG